ncbi:MAG: hypothetical protein IJ651_07095 [Bacteroidales bacterium]|nr:hypothetical protein [Bacteroidales bacterium]
MFGLFKHRFKGLEKEVSSLSLHNPVGLSSHTEGFRYRQVNGMGFGFVTLTPDNRNLLEWIQRLAADREEGTLFAVNLNQDIERSFSLVYDFADFIIIDTDSNNGIDSSDLADIPILIDELLNLRLCYEYLTPIFVRLPAVLTDEEMQSVLSYCQLSGINGIVCSGLSTVKKVLDLTLRRMPVIGTATSIEEAAAMLQEGASLIEMDTRPQAALKLLKTLEKEAKKA